MCCPHWPRLDVCRSLVCKLLESKLQQQELHLVSWLQGDCDDSETEQDHRSTADGGRRRRQLIITLPEVRGRGRAGVPLASLRLVMSANDPPVCG